MWRYQKLIALTCYVFVSCWGSMIYKHNSQNCLNLLCSSIPFFPALPFFDKFRQILLETVGKIIKDILHLNDDLLVNQLMYETPSYSFEENNEIINASIKYILDTERSSGPLI